MRDDPADSTTRKPNATTRSFGFVQDRIIVTAERKKGRLEEQENGYDARARARWWEEKEGTDLALDHPLTGRNEQRANATNLAGSTQPLGRRTIFLGHEKFVMYLWSPPVTFLATIPFSVIVSLM